MRFTHKKLQKPYQIWDTNVHVNTLSLLFSGPSNENVSFKNSVNN